MIQDGDTFVPSANTTEEPILDDEMVEVAFSNDGETLIRTDEFEALARPLIKYLCENYTPYYEIRITQETAELKYNLMPSFFTKDYSEGNNEKRSIV